MAPEAKPAPPTSAPPDEAPPQVPQAIEANPPRPGPSLAEAPPKGGSASPSVPRKGSGGAKVDTAASDAALKEAKSMYGMRCASCHGMDGSGKGPIAAALKPPPRDLRDPAWQSSVTDQFIEKIIERGGTAVGKSPAMPASPDLAGKPVVKGLRAYIRGLRE